MASLQGGTQLFDVATNGAAVNTDDVSVIGYIGPGPYVTVFIDSEVEATFKVQVANVASPHAGRNALNSDVDGGLVWYDYDGATALVCTAGAPTAFDLSPFGPILMRLYCVDGGAGGTVNAFVNSFGPN